MTCENEKKNYIKRQEKKHIFNVDRLIHNPTKPLFASLQNTAIIATPIVVIIRDFFTNSILVSFKKEDGYSDRMYR